MSARAALLFIFLKRKPLFSLSHTHTQAETPWLLGYNTCSCHLRGLKVLSASAACVQPPSFYPSFEIEYICIYTAPCTAVSGSIFPQVQCEKCLISMVEGHRAALMDLPPSTISNMNERGNRYYAQAISKHVYQSISLCKYFSTQYI